LFSRPYWSGRKLNIIDSQTSEDFYNLHLDKTDACMEQPVEFRENNEQSFPANTPIEINERIYRFVLNMPIVLFELDLSGKLLFVNDSTRFVIGYSPSELLGRDFWNILFSGDNNDPVKKITYLLETKGIVEDEFVINGIGNLPLKVFMYLQHSRGSDGEVTGLTGFFVNSNLRNVNHSQLAESEEKYRKLSEATSEGIVIHKKGEILEANDQFTRITGYTVDDLKSMDNTLNLVSEKDREKALNNLKTGFEGSYEVEYLKKDGTTAPVRIHVRNMTFREQPVRMIAISDLTEQRQVEAELRRERDLFSKIADTSPAGIIHFNRQGSIVFANRMAQRTLGLKGKNISEWTYNDSRWDIRRIDGTRIPDDDLPFRKVMDFGETVQDYLMSVVWSDGKRIFISVNASPLLNDKNEADGVITAVEDITESLCTENKLRTLNQRLMEHARNLSESNTDLEQFAYIASHDLREPLRMISGFTKLLEKRYKSKLDPVADEYINYITDGVERMERLISDLLSLSRISTKKQELKSVDCNAILKQVVVNLQAMLNEKKARIIYKDLPVITADPIQINQLFQNLISNAVKFNEKQPLVRISAENSGEYWKFSVEDNGIGIEPRNFKRIFQIFQRLHTRSEYAGSGMGLSICKKIIERHNGEIRLRSEPGKGSTFIFTIPVNNSDNYDNKLPENGDTIRLEEK
jgi:PAS domain S-box-containing protein